MQNFHIFFNQPQQIYYILQKQQTRLEIILLPSSYHPLVLTKRKDFIKNSEGAVTTRLIFQGQNKVAGQ